ncbi:hypothetical protein C8034_v009203 [Colletotrichum sidae]|uniref:Uncharacterized protein n=1 Tax=Colletotrichum sidae TaxID=1347389 RepID=A0A4R8TPH0_9PEZI|nr:hypothetical protein C8034_v009203 [Colletotrichum sidae]
MCFVSRRELGELECGVWCTFQIQHGRRRWRDGCFTPAANIGARDRGDGDGSRSHRPFSTFTSSFAFTFTSTLTCTLTFPPTRPTSAPSSASEQNHLSPASQPLILRPPCRIQCPVQIERQEGLRRYTVRVPSGAGVAGQLLHRDWPICC